MVSNLSTLMCRKAGTGEKPDPSKPDPNYTKNGSLNVLKKVVKNVSSEDATDLILMKNLTSQQNLLSQQEQIRKLLVAYKQMVL